MIMTQTPITRADLAKCGGGHVVAALTYVGITHWEELSGRCVCVLEAALPKIWVQQVQRVAGTKGVLVISHTAHTSFQSALTDDPANITLQVMASRAGCPLMYGPDSGDRVLVPMELVSNWDQPEAYWWRRGVDAAFKHAEETR
jgi:hypothetical protein